MAINYVKFQKGSLAAYNKLATKDSNTLYFIYPEKDEEGNPKPGSVGRLYLGETLISGGDVVLTAASLNDLADVITENAKTNDFLVYNGSEWVAKSLADVVALIKDAMGDIAAPANVFQVTKASVNDDDIAAIESVIPEGTLLAAGDSAIVKVLIANNKYEHTAYVYTGEEWAAMDGNYSAANVYTSSKITLAGNYGTYIDSRKDTVTINQIGNKKIGDEIEAGTSL
jgi:hypothetical protein